MEVTYKSGFQDTSLVHYWLDPRSSIPRMHGLGLASRSGRAEPSVQWVRKKLNLQFGQLSFSGPA